MGQWATNLMAYEEPTPIMTPIMPPVTLSSIASMRNWFSMSTPRAPTLMRRPISLVRSVTLTYMMFMIPIPPTMSEMPATQPSSIVIMSVVEFIIDASSSCERMLKSSSSASCVSVASFNLWLRRRMVVISSVALSVSPSVICAKECEKLILQINNLSLESELYRFLSKINTKGGDYNTGLKYARKALCIAESNDRGTWKGSSYSRMAITFAKLGDADSAAFNFCKTFVHIIH